MFTFIADSHVALRGLRPEIPYQDTLRPLEAVANFCRSKNCPLVIGGDLYDTNLPPARLVSRVNDILDGLETYVIQGNHDRDPEIPWGSLVKSARHIHRQCLNIGGLQVYGLDFAPSNVCAAGILDVKKCDVLIMHQAVAQGLGFEGAWNMDLNWVKPEITKNVLLGDLHCVREELWSNERSVRGLYTGSQYMTSVVDPQDPMFILVKGMGPDGFLDYQRIPLPARPFKDVELKDPLSVQQFMEVFEGTAFPEKPILHVTYPAEDCGIFTALKEALKDRAYLIERPEASLNRGIRRTFAVQATKGVTLAGLIDQKLKTDPDEGFKVFMRDLAACASRDQVSQTITKFREESLK